jgi:L-cysteine desulfidase
MYLERARTDASLQPNASVNESGPVSRTTSAAPNLILHNLKRVQAGLAGEVLGRDLTVQKQNPGEDYLDVPVAAAANEKGEEGEKDDLEMKDVEMETEAEAFAEQEEQSAAVDKEERKRRKKERRLAEKKAKAKKDVDSD